MITNEKVNEIFCIIDEFDKKLSAELEKNLYLPSRDSDGKRYRNRKGRLSDSEIMAILTCYHFITYRNFKEYYLNWAKGGDAAGLSRCGVIQPVRGAHAQGVLQDNAFHEAFCLRPLFRAYLCRQHHDTGMP